MRDAELWEKGCSEDEVRNRFVIPSIANFLIGLNIQRVIDVGSGTGYIARQIHEGGLNTINWTLVDIDDDRLALSRQLTPDDMSVVAISCDAFDLSQDWSEHCAVLLVFTLAEVRLTNEVLDAIDRMLKSEEGVVVVIIPDALTDIVKIPDPAERLSKLKEYSSGLGELDKVDKFTGAPYPFYFARPEKIIESFVNRQYSLVRLNSYFDGERRVFALLFQRS